MRIQVFPMNPTTDDLPPEIDAKVEDSGETLFLVFSPSGVTVYAWVDSLQRRFPNSLSIGISGAFVFTEKTNLDQPCIWAIEFEHVTMCHADALSGTDRAMGLEIGKQFSRIPQQSGILMLCSGTVNGEAIIDAALELHPTFSAVGGAAGFRKPQNPPWLTSAGNCAARGVAAIAFHGNESFHFNYGIGFGWKHTTDDPFQITASRGPSLLSLDDKPALKAVRKQYDLKNMINDEFRARLSTIPFSISPSKMVRPSQTLAAFDFSHWTDTIHFSRSPPVKQFLMPLSTSAEELIGEAYHATKTACGARSGGIALAFSFVGRKRFLEAENRPDAEMLAVQKALPHDTLLIGIYGHGEVAPATPNAAHSSWLNGSIVVLHITED